MKRFLVAIIGCIAALAAASAIAGTPGAPFGGDDGGFIPPDPPKGPITKCENNVGKAVGKLAVSILKCHCNRQTGKLADDAAEDACEQAALDKFTSLNTTKCPACIDLPSIGAGVVALLDANNDKVFCDPDGTPLGGDDTGTLASTSPIAGCECNVSKKVGTLIKSVLKCHGQEASLKLADDFEEDACEQKAIDKFNLQKTTNCPACVDLAAIAAFVESTLDGTNGLIYCAQPSSTTTTTAPTTTSTSTTAPPTTSTTTTVSTTTTTTMIVPTTTTSTTSTTTTTTSSTTTSTTTTTTSSTTTTTGGPVFTQLSFTTTIGSTSCGGPSFAGFTAPSAPFSGEVHDASNAKLGDLGLGCLYVGGGSAATPANQIPDGSQSIFDLGTPSGGTVPLVASNGTGRENCTKGAGPGKHCVGGNGGPIACTTDADCGGTPGSCALDANCNFGPPLPITGSLPVCVINAIQTDGSGTATPATGDSTVSIPLSSRVYLTANATDPCPRCISGQCDPTWKDNSNNPSPNSGAACTPTGSQATSLDCGVPLQDFQGALPVTLNPLSTTATTLSQPAGLFCPSQAHAGAFHLPTATSITETGSPAGDLTDGAEHPAVLAAVFCIPASLSAAINAVGDLPGPGATGLGGNAQLLP